MMPISQIDMVVFGEDQVLQVCGDLSPMAVAGNVPSSTDPQSFTIVVRQGDNVATLHAAGQSDREAFEFDPTNGRWELKDTLGPQNQFEVGKPAVVSAVIILKREPAGLETLSWVQPVDEIKPVRLTSGEQLKFNPEVLAQPPEIALEIGHSVSSSLTILQHHAAGGDTFHGLQRIDKVHQADPATP
jgi:hypothetical protein